MEKLNPLVIFLDFKNAFDTISHKKLTDKLEKMGMDNVTLAWFNSYSNVFVKDRQLLAGGVLRCSPFLCMHSIYIHILYIK